MDATMPPSILFDQIVKQAPFNATLFSDDVVLGKARLSGGNATPEKASAALAESLVRYFLTRDVKFRQPLDPVFGSESVDSFAALAAERLKGVPISDIFRPLRSPRVDSRITECVLRVIRERFDYLLGAGGLIPVYDGNCRNGFLLPFAVMETSAGASEVTDINGREIPDWTDAVRSLPDPGGKPFRIRVDIDARYGLGAPLPLTGRSLMLPVQMALWRKSGKLPRYNPLSIVSTGLFDDAGHLGIVETGEKAVAAAKLPGTVFIYPSDSAEGRSETATPIRVGADLREVFECLRDIAEERYVFDSIYALSRLNSAELADEMDVGRYGDWKRMARRLEIMLEQISKKRQPRDYLACLMMLGMANCHAAETTEALKWNQKARELAQSVGGFEYQLTRLKIELLVMLTDNEDFDALFKNAEELCSDDLSKFGNAADDIRMRFFGTMGQALAYASLAKVGTGDPKRAKDSFEEAFHAAERLLASERDCARLDRRYGDLAHDANYLHLWDVFFSPDSSPESRHEAELAYEAISDVGAKRKNYVFLMRQVALGFYRRLLLATGVVVPPAEDGLSLEDIVEDASIEPWLRATIAKYVGALKAASGEADDARRLLKEAASLLDGGGHASVARKIAMTIRAEAYRSLRKLFPDDAAQYLAEAKQLIDGVPDNGGRWRTWLEDPDHAQFPGLSYWY